MNEPVRPETLALDALIEETVARVAATAQREPADRMLFLGNRHHAFPTAVIKDPVLEPVDKLVWMVIMLGVQETGGNTSFPGYSTIGSMANIASRATIARAIAILRATRWLTLCRRVRTCSGRFCGNVYAMHDEPLPLADTCHLDTDYRTFLQKAAEHTHGRVRAVAQGVLCSINEDAAMGRKVMDQPHPIERRIESVVGSPKEGHRRFFSFTRTAVRQLRQELVTAQQTNHDHDQNLNTVKASHDQNMNTVCSSSYINKKTTTETAMSKFDLVDEDARPLVYPRRLGESHRELADRFLAPLAPVQRQPILDELEGRLQAEQKGMKPVYDEISFLISLCNLTKQGKFQPNLGIKVRAHRLECQTIRQRARAAAAISPETKEQREKRQAEGQARLTSMRRALGKSYHQAFAPNNDDSKTPSE
ncbi:MAG: helix-turn-helix domain-containing protein [Chromatiaceae bacterium]|nr:helix-turn-helix domain-containing protein [Chromatiaceae bacterium]